MTRRLYYQHGVLLPRSPFGHVDQAIGKNVAAGAVGLIAPTCEIVKDIEEMTVDGVKMVFQNTPGTEAHAEMNTWFPQFRAFWAAENITGTIHNIYTLRGALIRNALEWSRQINRTLHLFGQEAAEPDNRAARDLLADVFEQIGYQKESSSLRNGFFAGAHELRSGIPAGASPKTGGPDMVRGMTTGLLLDYLAVRLDSRKAEGVSFKVNLLTPDNGEKYAIELNNSALNSIRDFQIPNPGLTVTVNRSDIEKMLLGAASFEQLATTGKVRLEGNSGPLEQLKGMFVQFDIGFEILPGTMPAKAAGKPNKE